MLNALEETLPSITTNNISLQTPHLYHFDREQSTQILQDLSDTIDLKTAIVSSPDDGFNLLPQPISISIGHAVGAWLREFHSWVAHPAQADLARKMAANEPMRKLRYQISYGAFTDVVQKFPEVWDQYGSALKQVQDMAAREYAKSIHDEGVADWGVIHGDFWTGK
jgi:hypothetical protein